jgi:type IV secretion system protein VirB4
VNLFARSTPAGADWFEDAGDPSKLFPIVRFVSDDVFATRSGGYGATFSLDGVDTECLDDAAEAAMSSELLGGQRLVPENLVIYQIARKRRGFVPAFRHIDSANAVVAETQRNRREHLANSGFALVELFFTLYAPPPSKALHEWTPGTYADTSEAQLRQLEALAQMLRINLARFGLKRLEKTQIEELYSYIFNLHGNHPLPSSSDRIAEEIANERIQWNDDGIKVGCRYGKLFSLLKCPKFTHPNLFGELLRLDTDMVLVLETQRQTSEQTRKEVSCQETFANYFREKISTVLSYIGNAQQFYSKPKSATSQAADVSVGGLAGIIQDLDHGIAYTQTSLIGLLHSENKAYLDEQMAHVHRVASANQSVFLSEGIGSLCAFASLLPGSEAGGRSTNVRRRWIREDHVANISLVHAPYRGEAYSRTLEDESLAKFGTRDGTEFEYDPYTPGGLRGLIVLGESRRGKSFVVNYLLDNEPKYGGFVTIYDVGGSYENTVLKHGGSIVQVGMDGPRINPFAHDSERDRQFAYGLVKMLLERGGAQIDPDQDADISARVNMMFTLPAAVRRLKNLILPLTLQPYLNKWCEGGVYGQFFDNVEDELRVSRMTSFNFAGLGDQQLDLLEPLVYSFRFRVNSFTHDAGNLSVPKLEVFDEVFTLMKIETLEDQMVSTSKTGAKHLGGIILATQSPKDLGRYATLIRNNCPDALFLGGSFDRQQYIDLFDLNERQLDLITRLKVGESLLVRKDYAKVLKLDVDEQSKWLYTTHPKDRLRRDEAIKTHGREKAFEHLVASATAK